MSERVPESIPAAPDLALVGLEDLVDELGRRFETVIVAGSRVVGERAGIQNILRHSGTYLTAQGLCYRMLAFLEDRIRDTERDPVES